MAETLQAGRELDALVAEKVMGWRQVQSRIPLLGDDTPVWEGQPPRAKHDPNYSPEEIPPYSTDIGAAWYVVEKMRDQADPIHQTLRLIAYPYGRTYAGFTVESDDESWCEANSHEMPDRGDPTSLAICRAALHIVSVLSVQAAKDGR